MGVDADRDAKHAREAKVSKFHECVLVVDEDVLWLQVSVQDPAQSWLRKVSLCDG